jgi:hypothetical protein
MRISSTSGRALGCATLFALSACTASTSQPPVNTASSFARNLAPPGKALTPPRRLAAALFNSVVVLDSSYNVIQTITDGIKASDGVAFDPKENLYVSNSAGPTVTEYNKNGTLEFTYSADLIDPQTVAVDDSGNVYVPATDDGKASVVVEYPQGSNTPVASCRTGLSNTGVAIDSKGDVFVGGIVPGEGSSVGEILEYAGGLSGCNGTALDLSLEYINGLLFDKHDNLIVSDTTNSDIHIVPPPYKKIRTTLTGFDNPRAVALNEAQNLIYVVNDAYNDPAVIVDEYPSGKNVTTLGESNGITYAILGVAAYR